ncbi:uncharacterized protein A1O9_12779 [Exophiala aquamarina CBS 119918]|uniref:Uncharacterized protein n=1 Tax=Exophiala aquamarina CBS 119918 TaxID=1182545 RepID=A0A072P6B7_9EURO|nr:uncharacterized protein A1O9_12779 [Exophiala aquamarina CBS 119918]KEF51165.1 hypothetical protein A1O9_12779 [Exophiala aquamarina CBS 119918]
MVLGLRSRKHPGGTTVTTTTTTTRHPPKHNAHVAKPTLMQRLRGSRRTHPVSTKARPVRRTRAPRATRATHTTAAPRRKTSIGDKVSGAMLKLKGSLTRRPGQKAAGTRRMHGTDGRSTHRRYY